MADIRLVTLNELNAYNFATETDVANAVSGKANTKHTHSMSDITSGTLTVQSGGTGASTFTSGAALIGNGTGAITTRSIINNSSSTATISANNSLITSNTLRYALNRTTGPTAADTNYNTQMMRAISASTTDLVAGTSTLTSGAIYLVYE